MSALILWSFLIKKKGQEKPQPQMPAIAQASVGITCLLVPR
jgi:hypothetical protein